MQYAEKLKSLDRLIEDFGGSSEPSEARFAPNPMLLEHLEAARRYWLGANPDEYRFSLQQAQYAAASIADSHARDSAREALGALLENRDERRMAAPTVPEC